MGGDSLTERMIKYEMATYYTGADVMGLGDVARLSDHEIIKLIHGRPHIISFVHNKEYFEGLAADCSNISSGEVPDEW